MQVLLFAYPKILAWSELQIWRQIDFRILEFWFEIAYSRPLLGGFGGIFPQMTSSIVLTPKRHFLARKHVIWAIKGENRFNGSTWAQDREKKERTGQDRTVKKVTKALYFTYLGRSPHGTDFHKNLHSSCRPRRNHARKRLSWNFQGLRFYRGSNFPFSCWFFHGPYNSAALLCCLW